MSLRIGVGGVFIECNHFTNQLTDLTAFERSEYLRGAELLAKTTGVLGGMLSLLSANGFEPVPLLYASACPGGALQSNTYSSLKDELLQSLNVSGKLDGVLLCLHGAGAAVNTSDLEGDLARAVRERIGEKVPIVATLDLHAHITEELLIETDTLLAWKTYPHIDAFETGERGAQAIIDILEDRLKPFMAMAKVPLVVSAIHGQTKLPGPFADIMDEAKRLEDNDTLYSINPILVHPYLNLIDMGAGVLVVSNGDQSAAVDTAKNLTIRYWNNRYELQPRTLNPSDAIRRGMAIEGGPILLVETADCCGGGASGDSVHCLKALLKEAPEELAIIPVVDPNAAQLAHKVGVGKKIQLQLGHKLDPKWGEPVLLDGVVMKLSEGSFTYRGGIWDGRAGRMGLTAVLKVGSIHIIINSYPTYDWMTEQLDLVGLDIINSKFIVVKNPMNYKQAYEKIMKAAFVLDTPGPTPANTNALTYTNFTDSWFPLDLNTEISTPVILTSKSRDLARKK